MSNDECHTPNEFFKKLDEVFNFKLDAAATKKNTKCKKFFSKKDDALSLSWESNGYVWLNPPFSPKAGGILKWIQYAHRQTLERNCEGVVCLIICDVSTKAREYAWYHAHEIVELSPRINFMSPGKKGRKGGLQSYQLVIFKQGRKFQFISRWNWQEESFNRRNIRRMEKV